MSSITVSPDGRTLTAELLFSKVEPDGRFCQEIVDKTATESPTSVTIAIQAKNSCQSAFPWSSESSSLVGYPFKTSLTLKSPLGDRKVLDKFSGENIALREGPQ
ncbi:hypothetical protein [Sinosporangium album]|uniref:hypothetical protein n=1 Tax=Sinosporangium album TaxID=504805 RepID=UPI00115FAA9C|nr:hypothetical protein [Sinosporangium album]